MSAVNAMYVGDNPVKDFRGARELGMRTVRVRYESSLRFREDARDASDAPDAEIADLRQLEDVLGG